MTTNAQNAFLQNVFVSGAVKPLFEFPQSVFVSGTMKPLLFYDILITEF